MPNRRYTVPQEGSIPALAIADRVLLAPAGVRALLRREAGASADQLAYATEKALRDSGDRISETDRQSVQDALNELREALKGNDVGAINSARERLESVWAPVASSLYSHAGAAPSSDAGNQTGEPRDDVVDAEFRSSEER